MDSNKIIELTQIHTEKEKDRERGGEEKGKREEIDDRR